MAWLQNLAGRAEDLLNKIDQNAATVLNESISKSNLESSVLDQEICSNDVTIGFNEEPNISSLHHSQSFPGPILKETDLGSMTTNLDEEGGITFIAPTDESKLNINDSTTEDKVADNLSKTSTSEGAIPSISAHNSFVLAEETQLMHMKLSKLEFENQDLQKQLLNIKHLYSEIKNENNSLQLQLERASEQILEAQVEKETYKARAQRILQEKEKLILLKNEGPESSEKDSVILHYNEQLLNELQNVQSKNAELTQRNAQLIKEIHSSLIQHQSIQNDLQMTVQNLEQSLAKEKKIRTTAEDECLQKNNEIYVKTQEIIQLQEFLKVKNNEIAQLKETAKQKKHPNGDFDHVIKNLTHTLMMKQNNLETITTERNALKLQLEKLESEYHRTLDQLHRSKDKVVRIEEVEDSTSVPNVMRISPFDAGVTRRVKRAYSTLDAISIRTGLFLRRYPLARVFVFCYMVILHIWVLMILFWHEPSIQ